MGRKPNQLILEYFHRGPKLEDASNRYQHTCKLCGEKFPKGRIDSLTNHLVKKCNAIGVTERQRVLMRLHDMPDLSEGDLAKVAAMANATSGGKKKADAPYSTRPFDGLNVLAEASRQVGASDQPQRPGFTQAVTVGGKTVMIDPALETEAFHTQLNETGEENLLTTTVTTASTSEAATAVSPAPALQTDLLSNDASASNAAQNSSQLSMIAASASEMVPQTTAMEGEESTLPDASSRSDGMWHNNTQLSSSEQLLFETLQEHTSGLGSAQRAAAFPRPIAMNPLTQTKGFVNDFGDSVKPTKPKVRGRFDPIRRREVQDVRKKGACLRCRMLKKPCSEGTPCTTCASVESARLWKFPCIRTRLIDEFDLWMAGLYATLAFHNVNAFKNQHTFEAYSGRVEASIIDESDCLVAFSAQIGHKSTTMGAIDPQLQALVKVEDLHQTQELYILNTDADDIPGRMDTYMRRVAKLLFAQEASPFMKATLGLASELCEGLLDQRDVLLESVLQLWTASHILADLDSQWKVFTNSTLHPPMGPSNAVVPSSDEGRVRVDNNSESYPILVSQLRAAVEKRAGILAKTVMSEMERRLLMRNREGWFRTYLAAVILLNAVERTSWLFKSWDNETDGLQWPLDKRPADYASEAERFTEILHMILRMRNVMPKTVVQPDTGIIRAADGSHPDAIRFFDMVQVTPLYLEQRQSAEFDQHDSRSLDLKYTSRILQYT